MKRKFDVRVSFEFEIDEDDDDVWGYGQYPIATLTVDQVQDELDCCLSHEFCEDEAGLCSLPEDFQLEVVERKETL